MGPTSVNPFVQILRFTIAVSLSLAWHAPVQSAVIARFDFSGNDYTTDAGNTIGANTGLDLQSSAAAIDGISLTNILFSPGLDANARPRLCREEKQNYSYV